jgi:toxin ParE1/3/4
MDYSFRTWGEDRAFRYLDDLQACCEMRADNPALGRACDHVRPGLRRMESGILISRILHYRMLPQNYVIDDEDDGL